MLSKPALCQLPGLIVVKEPRHEEDHSELISGLLGSLNIAILMSILYLITHILRPIFSAKAILT
jgi:hypothetical protein